MLIFSSSFPLKISSFSLQMDPWLQRSALKTDLPIKALGFLSKTLVWIFSTASEPHPLVSAAAAAGVFAVLYLPSHLLSIFLSPVLLSTLFLLFTLLRFGTPPQQPTPPVETDSKQAESSPETERCLLSWSAKQAFCEPSLEWGGWGGPLEIIYEEYEGEEEESGECSPEYSKFGVRGFDGFCYSDSDMEREEEELIEIVLEEDNMFEIDLSAWCNPSA